MNNDVLQYLINLATFLSMEFKTQYYGMEWFARWALPEEIGMEWIDATWAIFSKELTCVAPDESVQLLKKILNNFESAFSDSAKAEVWTFEAMQTHPFWKEQRELAKTFLENCQAYRC